jgi:hypothetical protein
MVAVPGFCCMVSLSYKEYLRLASIADIVALNETKGRPALAKL